jgi:hypothetical protein
LTSGSQVALSFVTISSSSVCTSANFGVMLCKWRTRLVRY